MQSRTEEIEELKRIVNEIFLVDLDSENRRRDTVDARKVYSKILRESGFGYELIAETIGKNHATVIHYIKNIGPILVYDEDLRNKYVACKNIFNKKVISISEQVGKDADVYVTVLRLTNELQEAISSRNKVLDDFISYIEKYSVQRGRLPTIQDYRHTILPLFNEKR